MKPPFHITETAYQNALEALNALHFTDAAGGAADLSFLLDDEWLSNTAVIDRLLLRKGSWEIHLLFAHYQQPMKFVSRYITSNSIKNRANLMATYMRRLAAKDQRGTLSVDLKDLKILLN